MQGFFGIEPHFDLWKYFFVVSLPNKKKSGMMTLVPMGCASIHLRTNRASEYMVITPSKSNNGWHSLWFYVKNDDDAPLPTFTGRTIEEASSAWVWGPMEKKKKRLADLLEAIALLKRHGLQGIGGVRVYNARRVAPLMACSIPLYGMVPTMQLGGIVLA